MRNARPDIAEDIVLARRGGARQIGERLIGDEVVVSGDGAQRGVGGDAFDFGARRLDAFVGGVDPLTRRAEIIDQLLAAEHRVGAAARLEAFDDRGLVAEIADESARPLKVDIGLREQRGANLGTDTLRGGGFGDRRLHRRVDLDGAAERAEKVGIGRGIAGEAEHRIAREVDALRRAAGGRQDDGRWCRPGIGSGVRRYGDH